MSVGRICVRDVDLANPDESVWRAAERMHQRAVGSLVIVDDDQRPIGILTDRDLVERVVAAGRDPNATPVRDVMTHDLDTVHEDTPIEMALDSMRRKAVRRIPVVDEDGKLAGLLSIDDVIGLLAEELAMIGKLIERQTPRAAAGP